MAGNRGYRYGDGLFETIKVAEGQLLLGAYHFDRLFAGLSLLQYEIPRLFNREKLKEEILHLCKLNQCSAFARVRLSVFRGNGGLQDDDRGLQYLIECWPLQGPVHQLNENGLVIGLYPDARKSCDAFSGLKSASFLPYSMAAQYARQQRWNDCLILNTRDGIADSTIANLFLVKGDEIITPGTDQGCVEGVMRRHLLESMSAAGYKVKEQAVRPDNLAGADELFLSNAIRGIRWVGQLGDTVYTNNRTREIFNRFVATISP